jgi:rhamnose transport system permease protein
VLPAIVMGLVVSIFLGLLLILVIALPIVIRRIRSKVAA